MESFTPFASAAGGALIGAAASLYLLGDGRIAGISGIVDKAVHGEAVERSPDGKVQAPALFFLLGLALAGIVMRIAVPGAMDAFAPVPLGVVVLAGLLVGYGTRLSGGCTSGHGVCGLSRFSVRSLVATLVFMAAAVVTVFVVRHVVGGGAP